MSSKLLSSCSKTYLLLGTPVISSVIACLWSSESSCSSRSLNDFLSNVNKVDSIILRLETLESEKNKLKEELKIFENEFFRKKKLAEDEINKISQKKEMIEKTINVIKNLKSF